MKTSTCPRPLAIRTLVFSKRQFEVGDVFSWCDEHGVDLAVEHLSEAPRTYHAELRAEAQFLPGSFRTIRLPRSEAGIRAVIGCPRRFTVDRLLEGRSIVRSTRPERPGLARTRPRSVPAHRRRRS